MQAGRRQVHVSMNRDPMERERGPMDRRAALRSSLAAASGLAATGLSLTGFAESLARAAESDGSKQPKSLLILWMQGGPSQLETFDPHPNSKIGGDTKSISTSVKGLSIADTMPATAEQMHKATLVRSVVSKEGDHERATYHVKTGWRPDPTIVHPAIGSIVCHQSEDNIEIPRHISIQSGQWPARAGYLGPSFDAFQIRDPMKRVPNLTPRVNEERMEQRLGPLLEVVESEFERGRLRDMDRKRTLHQTATKKAIDMMHSDQLSAFNVKDEDAKIIESFGDSTFGTGCLAAVRLLQNGVRCVEVELSGWDSHINNHELQSSRASVLDRALASTLRELEARDMLDSTVVFCGGEFGRTPTINPAGGRDHWPHGFSALLAGGNFRKGYVHGATTEDFEAVKRRDAKPIDPSKVTQDMISVPDLHATLLHALGIDPSIEMMTPIGRPLRWSDGEIHKELLDS